MKEDVETPTAPVPTVNGGDEFDVAREGFAKAEEKTKEILKKLNAGLKDLTKKEKKIDASISQVSQAQHEGVQLVKALTEKVEEEAGEAKEEAQAKVEQAQTEKNQVAAKAEQLKQEKEKLAEDLAAKEEQLKQEKEKLEAQKET